MICSILLALFPEFISTQNSNFINFLTSILPLLVGCRRYLVQLLEYVSPWVLHILVQVGRWPLRVVRLGISPIVSPLSPTMLISTVVSICPRKGWCDGSFSQKTSMGRGGLQELNADCAMLYSITVLLVNWVANAFLSTDWSNCGAVANFRIYLMNSNLWIGHSRRELLCLLGACYLKSSWQN